MAVATNEKMIDNEDYPAEDTQSYDYKFRVLVMHLFMDDLGLEEIEKYFFIGGLPCKVKDDPTKLRSEILTYIRHEGLLDEWTEKPRILRRLLKDLGRMDLANKVQVFTGKCYVASCSMISCSTH